MKRLMRIFAVWIFAFLFCMMMESCGQRESTCTHMWVEATCVTPKICTLCSVTEGNPLGHEVGEWIIEQEPTCTADGHQTRSCRTCEQTIDIAILSALGHTWDEGTTITSPSCTENGRITFACLLCSESKTEDLITLGHDWITTYEVSPTLNTEGMENRECVVCDTRETRVLEKVDPSSLHMPIVYMTDLDSTAIPLIQLKKEDGETAIRYRYVSNDPSIKDFEGFAKIKIQGSSSAGYPKKNFTVKLYEDAQFDSKLKVNLGWGKENKYCMKANYIDITHARNIVSAEIFTQVVESREHIHDGLKNAPHYGVIDGYPVLVYVNDTFYGLYTMNIPKDEWMFGIDNDEATDQAILMAASWSDSVMMRKEIGYDFAADGWEVEYCSTDDHTWVKRSFNRLIALLNCGDGVRIQSELADHLDIEAAIDNMIFTYFINAADNTAKNVLWVTYDGVIWIPSMYDMDGSFGIFWDGSATDAVLTESIYSVYPSYKPNGAIFVDSMMHEILLTYFADEVEARYRDLRASILTYENTETCFRAFFSEVPDVVYQSDLLNWPHIPGRDTNRSNMLIATKAQLDRLDRFFYNFNR